MSEYTRYLDRAEHQHGARFDPSDLAPQFAAHFRTGQRIKVRFSHGEVKTGRVGVTTGWKPIFILLARANSSGSSDTLGADDAVIAVQRGPLYYPITDA